ncbi:MAG: NADH-quinone oxidoreductase subunit NuoH [SAR202 cluster bacterium]|nr:NADH-quinone oxidoreductase subunit NuoH [SAR202 cluster bacterium]
MTALEVLYYALGAVGLLVFLSMTVMALTWLERKTLARIQQRMGPMRVGPHGTLQPIADVLKLMSKEDITPSSADKRLFWLAPVAFFLPALLLWVTIPLSRDLVLRNMDMGLFYIVAISVLSVAGLALAGWSSANKYALLGGLRAVGALISYEIPFILAVLGVGMLAQSLDLTQVVDGQQNFAYILIQPLGLFIFLAAGLAELGRTPFDIHHAESEVVGGPFVEYSGAHWAVFMLAEYVNTFTIAALTVLLFLGGWRWPAMPLDGVGHTILSLAWFLAKTYLVILVIFWIRGTFPRLRIDQLMSFSWKVLVPLSFANILFTGIVLYYDLGRWVLTILSLLSLAAAFYLVFNKYGNLKKRNTVRVYSVRELGLKPAAKPPPPDAPSDGDPPPQGAPGHQPAS